MNGKWMVAILIGLGILMAFIWFVFFRPTALRIRQETPPPGVGAGAMFVGGGETP